MKYDAVIFDMGNTLVSYFSREQWPDVLADAIEHVSMFLTKRGLMRLDADELTDRVTAERAEAPDHCVRPLAGRLENIFKLAPGQDKLSAADSMAMCRRFMRPVFAMGWLYDDSISTLAELRGRGVKTGILSNTPWGSPGDLWREELTRLGLLQRADVTVFCTDVGWRKPDARPFQFIVSALGVETGRCLFVGDDPRWDIAGPRGVGMDAVLIDRAAPSGGDGAISDLSQLAALL